MDEKSLLRGLEYAAASIEAMQERFLLIRQVLVSLVQEINRLRALQVPPLDPLKPADLLQADFDRFLERRQELLARIRGQRQNELKPWEAV